MCFRGEKYIIPLAFNNPFPRSLPFWSVLLSVYQSHIETSSLRFPSLPICSFFNRGTFLLFLFWESVVRSRFPGFNANGKSYPICRVVNMCFIIYFYLIFL